jgi:hypothetical protein
MKEILLKHVHRLSVEIGPRRPTGEGERKGAEYVRDCFAGYGLNARVEEFKSVSTYSYLYAILFGASLLAGALGLAGHEALSAIIGLFSFLLFGTENNSFPVLFHLLKRNNSYNSVGVLEPSGTIKRTLIISAHIDSSRSGINFHPKMVAGLKNSFKMLFGSMLIVPLVSFINIFIGSSMFEYLVIPPMGLIAFAFVTSFEREIFGKDVPGANDNASGTSVMLGLAERFGSERPKNTRLIFVGTGSEEAGIYGMIEFLNRWKDEISGAKVLNLDHLGLGTLHYILEEGMTRKFPSDPELIAHAAAAVAERKDLCVKSRPFRVMLTDSVASMARGYGSMSLMAFDANGINPNWHWKTDVYENVDGEALRTAYEFAGQIIKKLDQFA